MMIADTAFEAPVLQPTGTCRLLALPPEVRNLIYDLVLTARSRYRDGTVSMSPASTTSPGLRRTPIGPPQKINSALKPSVLAMLQTCKQIKSEAETIFYHINHLRFSCCERWCGSIDHTIHDFVRAIGTSRVNAIRTMTILFASGEAVAEAVDALQGLHGLTTLHLELKPYSERDWSVPSVNYAKQDIKNAVAELRCLQVFTLRMTTVPHSVRRPNVTVEIVTRAAAKAQLKDIEDEIRESRP